MLTAKRMVLLMATPAAPPQDRMTTPKFLKIASRAAVTAPARAARIGRKSSSNWLSARGRRVKPGASAPKAPLSRHRRLAGPASDEAPVERKHDPSNKSWSNASPWPRRSQRRARSRRSPRASRAAHGSAGGSAGGRRAKREPERYARHVPDHAPPSHFTRRSSICRCGQNRATRPPNQISSTA